MRLTIFGATGGTGRHLVRQALDEGHQVTAVARDPARLDVEHERLQVARGDVLELESIIGAVARADAVLSAIGHGSGRAPTTVYSAGTANIVRAMQATGTRRLVVVSAAPVSDNLEGTTLPYRRVVRPLLWAMFGNPYSDMAGMQEEVAGSGLEWTIMLPPRLTNKPRTGRYRLALNGNLRGGNFISRADLADAILRLLDDPGAVKAVVGIGY
jgi:putative NADH-flavin reductase